MKYHFSSFTKPYLSLFLSLFQNFVNLRGAQTLNFKASCAPSFTAVVSSQVLISPQYSVSCICPLNSTSCFRLTEPPPTLILLNFGPPGLMQQ